MKAVALTKNTDGTDVSAKSFLEQVPHFLFYWSLPLMLLLIWQGLSAIGVFHDYTMPSPGKVMQSFLEIASDGTLLEDKIFVIMHCADAHGEMMEQFEGGKNFWMTQEELVAQDKLFESARDFVTYHDQKIPYHAQEYTYDDTEY